MTSIGILQIVGYVALILLAARPLGSYMARVFQRERTMIDPILGPVERLIYRFAGVRPDEEMDWKANAAAMLLFNAVGFAAVYALQRVQGFLPLNPQGFPAVPPDSSFNTAVSFASNTNWQGYGGETTMSYLTQMAGLTVQNFVSAATGMAVLALFTRGISRHSTRTLGNFWVDMTRSTLYILLPWAAILALLLVSQGVVQNFQPYTAVPLSRKQQTREEHRSTSRSSRWALRRRRLPSSSWGRMAEGSSTPILHTLSKTPLRSRICSRCLRFFSSPPHCVTPTGRWSGTPARGGLSLQQCSSSLSGSS